MLSLEEHILRILDDVHPQHTNCRYLLAVSGGLDSTVLAHLFSKNNLNFSIAHCNFQLRSEDSNLDENFVKLLASDLEVDCFMKRFDMAAEKEKGESTQMTARRIRYAWFDELMQNKFDYLVVAHHFDDQLETFLVNLSRGAGVKGLSAMKACSNNLLRPMLTLERSEILEYAQANSISWREDASNASDDYLRNNIRHHASPEFRKIISKEAMESSLQNLDAAADAIAHYVQEEINRLQIGSSYVPRADFIALPQQIKFGILSKFGFNADQLTQLEKAKAGAQLFSDTHQIDLQTNQFNLRPIMTGSSKTVAIPQLGDYTVGELSLTLSETSNHSHADLGENEIKFDLDKVVFPLVVRSWQPADRFTPLGMKGQKKLSDFFIDLKYAKAEKEQQLLLVDARGIIVWIMGKRMSDEVKLTKNTNKVVHLVTSKHF